ncbi:MAG TPA: transglycosylase SLT domain-containing protein [Gemmatimonadaceae bacterium]|nr:transglycosylase SLT domain-containing protein [Gemmatimonadaceae bacterium]
MLVVFRRLSAAALLSAAACSHESRPQLGAAPSDVADSRITARGDVLQSGAVDPSASVQYVISEADLNHRTAQLFGDTARSEMLHLPVDSMLPADDNEPTWDIEVRSYEMLDRVQHYVSAFTRGESRDRFVDRLSVGTRYEPMIRAKLRAGDLPEDMYYLALVESGFNPNAYSRAAAVGMWQFMSSTARGMGLRVDWWVDERRDPVRSTQAAVAFLRGLREQFGSMYLAAAAYNGGPGRIARGLSKYADDLEGQTGDDAFFALAEKKYLRTETRDYVPQLVAAALVAKDSGRYGLSIPTLAPFVYDSVRVGPRIPLAAIAMASEVPVATIRELNPHILRGMTPPRDSMLIRIPPGSRTRFDSAFATLDSADRTAVRVITNKKPASWESLASVAKVPARAVQLYNPTVKPSKRTGIIPVGTSIMLPAPSVVAAATYVPDPGIERYGGGTRTHVVRSGENLSVIAKRYGTTPAAIMRLNRLKKPIIFPGQELLVNGKGRTSSVSTKTKRATSRNR